MQQRINEINEITHIQSWDFSLMLAYRLSRKIRHAPLSGKGAAIKGARWNSVSVELIYTALAGWRNYGSTLATLCRTIMPMLTIYLRVFNPKAAQAGYPADWNRLFPICFNAGCMGDKFCQR